MAGLVRGPKILKIVRMPMSRRGCTAYFIASWSSGAKRKPIPILAMHCSTRSFGASTLTPKAPKTSALPDWLDTERLPCLATLTPAPANTNAVVVEILNVPFWSPPVPQVSSTVLAPTFTRCAFSRITRAAPVISPTLSPFMRRAVRKAATCSGEASPVMIWFITSIVSASERSIRFTNFSIASRMFMPMTADLLGCRKRLRITFLRAQRLHHLVRVVARTELTDTDAKPCFAVVLDLRNIGVVAFILKPINYLLSRALVRKSIHLGAPSLARLFRFRRGCSRFFWCVFDCDFLLGYSYRRCFRFGNNGFYFRRRLSDLFDQLCLTRIFFRCGQ